MKKTMEKIRDIKKTLVKICEAIIALIVFALVVVNIVQIITRYFIKVTFLWSEDFTLLGLLWMAGLGVPMIWMLKTHLRVDLFRKKMSEGLITASEWLIEAVGFVTGIALIRAGNEARIVNTGYVMSPMGFDESFRYIPLIVCGAGMLIATALNMGEMAVTKKDGKEET